MDRDTPELHYVGEWWLPSAPTSRTRGTLVVGAQGRATLSLDPVQSLGPISDGGSPIASEFFFRLRETYPLVFGEAYDGSADKSEHHRVSLTLTGCCLEYDASTTRGAVYQVGAVVVGDIHVPSLRFNELQFDIPNLEEAFPGNRFFQSSYFPDSALRSTGVLAFTVHGVVQRWLVNSGLGGTSSRYMDLEISFVHDIEMGHPPSCTTSLTDRYGLILRFRSRKWTWSIEMAQWFWERFSQLLWLVIGLKPACKGVMATVDGLSGPTTFRIFSDRLIDQSAFWGKPYYERHPLISVTELSSHDINFLWSHWDLLYLQSSDVLLLRGIAQQLFDRGLSAEGLLLNVAALESLHQVWVPPGYRSQNRVQSTNLKTGNKALAAYAARLAYEYSPELTEHAADLSLAMSAYRNYIAHHSSGAKKIYEAWPQALMEVVPMFSELLLDMSLLDFAGSMDWRRYPRKSDQTRLARQHVAHSEHVRLVHYIAMELDRHSSKPAEAG